MFTNEEIERIEELPGVSGIYVQDNVTIIYFAHLMAQEIQVEHKNDESIWITWDGWVDPYGFGEKRGLVFSNEESIRMITEAMNNYMFHMVQESLFYLAKISPKENSPNPIMDMIGEFVEVSKDPSQHEKVAWIIVNLLKNTDVTEIVYDLLADHMPSERD